MFNPHSLRHELARNLGIGDFIAFRRRWLKLTEVDPEDAAGSVQFRADELSDGQPSGRYWTFTRQDGGAHFLIAASLPPHGPEAARNAVVRQVLDNAFPTTKFNFQRNCEQLHWVDGPSERTVRKVFRQAPAAAALMPDLNREVSDLLACAGAVLFVLQGDDYRRSALTTRSDVSRLCDAPAMNPDIMMMGETLLAISNGEPHRHPRVFSELEIDGLAHLAGVEVPEVD